MNKALITGGTGYIGSRLAESLLAGGWDVSLWVRDPKQLHYATPFADRYRIVSGEGVEALQDHFARVKPDVVFHLAAGFVFHHTAGDLDRLLDANVRLGLHLLESMKMHGVGHLLLAGSTMQNYQGIQNRPLNLYAATKQAFETLLDYYCDAFSMKAITLEIFDSYGPGDERGKIVGLLLDAERKNKRLEMSQGIQEINLVHVSDIVSAFQTAARLVLTVKGHRKYSLHADRSMTLRDLVVLYQRARGVTLDIHFGAKPYPQRFPFQTPFLHPKLPEWEAVIPLEEGFRNLS